MYEERNLRGQFAQTNPSQQRFSNDGDGEERGRSSESRQDGMPTGRQDQGSLFKYSPGGEQQQQQQEERQWMPNDAGKAVQQPELMRMLPELMAMAKPLINKFAGKESEYANEKGFNDLERIEDELEGWLGYRDLAKKDPRYKHVAKQEFGHMLLAIQDLLQYIYEETRECPEERREMYNFINMMRG